jgi:hypothetical protein
VLVHQFLHLRGGLLESSNVSFGEKINEFKECFSRVLEVLNNIQDHHLLKIYNLRAFNSVDEKCSSFGLILRCIFGIDI